MPISSKRSTAGLHLDKSHADNAGLEREFDVEKRKQQQLSLALSERHRQVQKLQVVAFSSLVFADISTQLAYDHLKRKFMLGAYQNQQPNGAPDFNSPPEYVRTTDPQPFNSRRQTVSFSIIDRR